MSSSAALPEGWNTYQDAEGRTYYGNSSTGESTYTHPAPPAQRAPLPEGWAEYADPEGRPYYANVSTGETSWTIPAPAAAPPAAPSAAVAGAPQWSTEMTYALGGEGCEKCFEGRATLLDRGWSSVVGTVEALNANRISIEAGYCVLFSQSRQQYYLLWRSDRENEAFAQVDIAEGWSTAQVVALGPPGNEQTFEGRAGLLDRSLYPSVSAAVEALNSGTIQVDIGYCVVFSASQQTYYLLYHSSKEEQALNAVGIPLEGS